MTKKRSYIALLAANALIYALNAFYYSFIPIYLEQKGHTNNNIGYILAAAQLMAAVAPFFWGVICDKAKYKNNVLSFLVLCSSACFVAICFNNSLVYLFIMFPVLMFFKTNYGGLIDTISIEASYQSGCKYGNLRLMGTLGFGALSMFFAPFIHGENIKLLFIGYPIVGILSVIALILSPKVEGHAKKKEKISLKPLFGDRAMIVIFVILTVSLLTFNYYQNFYAKYIISPVENGGLGIADWVMGVNAFITIGGEIVFFLLYNTIMEKIGVKKLLWIMVFGGILRYVGLAAAKNVYLILAIGLITGVVPTIVTYCSTYYIMRTVAPNMRASAQMAMYAVCSAFPRVIGCALGGIMTDKIGTPGGLWVCAILNAASFFALLFLPKNLYKEEITNEQH